MPSGFKFIRPVGTLYSFGGFSPLARYPHILYDIVRGEEMNKNKKTSGPAPEELKPGHPGKPSGIEEFAPKTAFGKELWALRQKAVADGMSLLTNEEILAEIELRRYGRTTESHE